MNETMTKHELKQRLSAAIREARTVLETLPKSRRASHAFWYKRMHDLNGEYKRLTGVSRLAIAFFALTFPLTAHAAPIASAPGPTCAYSTPTEDEGAVYAVCPDGTAYYLDRDGQPFPNAAGVPVRPPGWVRLA